MRTPSVRSPAVLALVLAVAVPAWGGPAWHSVLMPVPRKAQAGSGRLKIEPTFTASIAGPDDGRVKAALDGMRWQWEQRSGLTFARAADATFSPSTSGRGTLVVEFGQLTAVPQLREDESYTLEVSAERATLRAPTSTGALRGVATLTQLFQGGSEGWFLPAVSINDRPRFPWRGLLIDVARHWIPGDVIRRCIDGMALVKLNVLHLHLCDDQGFRIESRTLPKLHELGSDGQYYTQQEMWELVAYAGARGIRVVPEFDVPGHATTWVVGYPELASAPGPYAISRQWGVHDVVLDPTNEALYGVLDKFFGEMAELFPDRYVHIGGDENNGRQWNANPRIQEFIRANGLKDNAGLHAYFNRRLQQIVARHGKVMVGWDEILHPDLPPATVIQSWRGAGGLAAAAKMKFAAFLSHGNYLDHELPAWRHYANDPLPSDTALTPEEQRRVLGGEACMWGEWATAQTIEFRIWPRAAVVAERLWSPREVTDVADMYRRLAIVSARLEEAGSRHLMLRDAMIRRFAGDVPAPALAKFRELADLFEATTLHVRSRAVNRSATQFTPLTGFADCVVADSPAAREFAARLRGYVLAEGSRDAADGAAIKAQLDTWSRLGGQAAAGEMIPGSPRSAELAPLGRWLVEVVKIGRESFEALASGKGVDAAASGATLKRVTQLEAPQQGVSLPIVGSVRLLVAAAAEEATRPRMSASDWKAAVERRASPPPAPVKK